MSEKPWAGAAAHRQRGTRKTVETEARRLLQHGNTGTTLNGRATACIQETAGGARAGAASHTPAGGGAAVKPSTGEVGPAEAVPSGADGGKPVAGLCSEHQGHCMPRSDMGALPLSGEAASALTQTMPVVLQICTQSLRSDAFTTACASVGASTVSSRASRASQTAKRR